MSTYLLQPFNTIVHGQNVDIDAAAELLVVGGGDTPCKAVVVKAISTNDGIIYVGNSNAVTAITGFELTAGESVMLAVDNVNKIWVIASIADQKAYYIGVF